MIEEQEHERLLRRNALGLVWLLLYVPEEEALGALGEARALLAGATPGPSSVGTDLWSRLPPRRADAYRTLRMVRVWLVYLNTGEVDMVEAASVGTRHIVPEQDLGAIPEPYYGRPQVVSSR